MLAPPVYAALAVDDEGRPVASAYRELAQHYPRPGWVEHDAIEIWQLAVTVLDEVARTIDRPIAAIGITNQRETVVAWDRRTGRPLHKAIVWQDRRTAARCSDLEAHLPEIRANTGLVLDPYFSATKIEWLLRHGDLDTGADLAFGTVDTWLAWNLTGGASFVTDPSNASRTMLYDIRAQRWSTDLLALFDIPSGVMADVVPSTSTLGTHDRTWLAAIGCSRVFDVGRPAGRIVRPSLFRTGHGEEHLRDGLVRVDERRRYVPTTGRRSVDDRRVATRRRLVHVRARRRDIRHRRSDPVVARRHRDDRRRPRDRPARGVGARQRGRRVRARVHRPRQPVVGSARAVARSSA